MIWEYVAILGLLLFWDLGRRTFGATLSKKVEDLTKVSANHAKVLEDHEATLKKLVREGTNSALGRMSGRSKRS